MSPDKPNAMPRIFPATPQVTVEEYYVDAGKLIDGNPKQSLWLEYEDPTGQFCSGVWGSEVGAWRIRYTEEEYCRIIEGHSLIVSDAGEEFAVKAGDEFVIPAGFSGVWRVVEPTRKRFVIYEQRSD